MAALSQPSSPPPLKTSLGRLNARGGTTGVDGGAGSIYLRSAASVRGDLVIDARGASGDSTRLPALGAGVAQAGSGGTTLVTDLSGAAPAFFMGHWVEIFDGATGDFETAGRIEAIDGTTLTLVSPDGEVIAADPGDFWQGAYLFDNLTMRGSIQLFSADPIRVEGAVEIDGAVQLRELTAVDLTLKAGASLNHPVTPNSSSPESLTLILSGDMVMEPGARIDVSRRGYPRSQTYPGESGPGHESGGSHMGLGGNRSSVASSFGSVYRPRESGGGGQDGDRRGGVGGGVVRIVAANLTLADSTSVIRANGGIGRSCCSRRRGRWLGVDLDRRLLRRRRDRGPGRQFHRRHGLGRRRRHRGRIHLDLGYGGRQRPGPSAARPVSTAVPVRSTSSVPRRPTAT